MQLNNNSAGHSPEEIKKLQSQVLALEAQAKSLMSSEAISRYSNIKTVNQEKALEIIALILQLAKENKIQRKISDEELKMFLMHLDKPKKEFKITRK